MLKACLQYSSVQGCGLGKWLDQKVSVLILGFDPLTGSKLDDVTGNFVNLTQPGVTWEENLNEVA